jgi:hypothetical protein
VGDSEAPDFEGSRRCVRVESERDLDTAGPEPVNMGTPEKPGSFARRLGYNSRDYGSCHTQTAL